MPSTVYDSGAEIVLNKSAVAVMSWDYICHKLGINDKASERVKQIRIRIAEDGSQNVETEAIYL